MSTNKVHRIGIDIGGTSIDLGLIHSGRLIEQKRFDVVGFKTKDELLGQLINTIGSFDLTDVRGIGIGVPGIIDPSSEIIVDLQNLPIWSNLPLKEILSQEFSLPIKMSNDAACFTLGHARYGQCKLYKNFVGLTLGTGLGMGIIINGALYTGVMAGAGELGMLPYRDGILEDFAASMFFKDRFGLSARELNIQAQQGQTSALSAFTDYGYHLGNAIKIVMSMIAPEAIILGGSITKASSFFWPSMKVSVDNFEYTQQREHTKIILSCQSDMGVIGAAALI